MSRQHETVPKSIWTPPLFGWQYELTWRPSGSWYYSDENLSVELFPRAGERPTSPSPSTVLASSKESVWALGGFRIRLVTGAVEIFEPGPIWQKVMPKGVRRFEQAVEERLESLEREKVQLEALLERISA